MLYWFQSLRIRDNNQLNEDDQEGKDAKRDLTDTCQEQHLWRAFPLTIILKNKENTQIDKNNTHCGSGIVIVSPKTQIKVQVLGLGLQFNGGITFPACTRSWVLSSAPQNKNNNKQ